MIKVHWTGAAGLEFFHKGKTLLVDPYYTRAGKKALFFGRIQPDNEKVKKNAERMNPLSAIIVSHTHFDHAVDVPEFAKYLNGLLIGSHSLETLMAMSGTANRTIVCSGGETIDLFDDVKVTMLPSRHGLVACGRVPYQGEITPDCKHPLKAKEYRVGTVFSPKIDIGGKTFLHVGSANYIEDELSGISCDVLFLCVAGWKKIKGYPEKIIEITQPDKVVLFHYDDFFKPYKKNSKTKILPFMHMDGMVKQIKEHSPGVEIIIPELFETMEF